MSKLETVENDITAHRKYGELLDGRLQLPAGTNQTIHVSSLERSSGRIPVFALSERGPWYHEGFEWKYAPAQQSLMVTFELGSDIARVVTSHGELHCSTCSNSGRQQMKIPAQQKNYDFDVEFKSGYMHDPIIVVTPVNNPPQ